MNHSVWVIATFVGLLTPLFAQQEADRQTTPPQDQLCTVEGDVSDRFTNGPISGATITARGGGTARATTDSKGRYVLTGLAPGTYTLLAQKDGYGDGLSERPRLVRLLPGVHEKGVNFQLRKEAVLSGRVLDSDRNAVVGAIVGVYHQAFRDGRPFFQPRKWAQTDDRGQYRIAGLKRGKYYIAAAPKKLELRAKSPLAAGRERTLRMAVIRGFYSNGSSLDTATPVYVHDSEQIDAIDLVLATRATFCASASVRDDAANAASAYAQVMVAETAPGWYSVVTQGRVQVGAEFEVCGLAPAAYSLIATTSDERGGAVHFVSNDFTVSNRDVDLDVLPMVGGQDLTGKFVMATNANSDSSSPSQPSIVAEPRDGPYFLNEGRGTRADPTGQFTLHNLFARDYWIRILSLPDGVYVKEATVGGRDALRSPVRVGGEIRILLGSDGASVSGQVTDKDNRSVPDATVILSSKLTNAIRTQLADQSGQFRFSSGIAPGEYRILALVGSSYGDAETPDFVRDYLSGAESIDLKAGDHRVLSLVALNSDDRR